MSAANSIAAQAVINSPPSFAPASFNNDPSLFLFNLFLMTGAFFIGVMMVGRQGSRIWQQRLFDHPLDPVSVYRAITLFAGIGLTLRCGAEALHLWSWDQKTPDIVARALMAKRWLDPIAVMCGMVWMSLVVLGEPGLEHQLRKAPMPVDMWSRWPVMLRALVVLALSFAAALIAVCLR
ncbi:hypothetical protein [Sphingomonas yantingensis]|uniref:Uncharacterized protein n=1 Tax=Sphingomonas yantingensis TaxID=1241761 RepID=A0A7W9AMD5_9SPHN|nr:hypothetical protein [Sphingomonas yantingensis]MBB5696998.1 hypothetical protein [Sphingomonas yantingensis]